MRRSWLAEGTEDFRGRLAGKEDEVGLGRLADRRQGFGIAIIPPPTLSKRLDEPFEDSPGDIRGRTSNADLAGIDPERQTVRVRHVWLFHRTLRGV